MTIRHTKACVAATALRDEAIAAFDLAYPNACKSCGGSGGCWWPGSWDTPSCWDDCPECMGKDTCPRCGKHYEATEAIAGYAFYADGVITYYSEEFEQLAQGNITCDCGFNARGEGFGLELNIVRPEPYECQCVYDAALQGIHQMVTAAFALPEELVAPKLGKGKGNGEDEREGLSNRAAAEENVLRVREALARGA